MTARVRAIAHRGASADRPENTLVAFDEALAQGADGIELDVQLSRDGVPVVWHDRTLRKAGGGLRPVGALALAELRQLDAGGWFAAEFRGSRIPTLAEVLERYAGRTGLLVELKVRRQSGDPLDLARGVARVVGERGLAGAVDLLCFDDAPLAAAARSASGLRLVLNLDPPARLDAALARRLAGLHAVSVDVRRLTGAFAAAVHERGLPLYTWTCNTARAVDRALAAGASAVMSDRPAWLRERLRERESAA